MILEYFKLSIKELFNNKLRTFLSLIGIVIGVAVVYVIFSLNDIANAAISNKISGTDGSINISYVDDKNDKENNTITFLMNNIGANSTNNYAISDDDINALLTVDGVSDAIANYTITQNVSMNRKSVSFNVKKNTSNFVNYYNLNLISGHYIEDYDIDKRDSIAIVSDSFLDRMNIDYDDAIGQKIKVTNKSFIIVGVSKSSNEAIRNMVLINDTVYDTMYSSHSIQNLSIKVIPNYDFALVSKNATDLLNRLHNMENSKNGFVEQDLSLIIDQIKNVTGILSIVMSVIASISLLVAGIGVMNIMLVSVVERTKEIGVKRAIGASKNAISFQFIVESSLLTLIGGVIGILLGLTIIRFALLLLQMDMPINFTYIFIAILFSISLGILFGYLPAKRAAELNIIEAIQSE